MTVKIDLVSNGYILTVPNVNDEGMHKEVIEILEDSNEPRKFDCIAMRYVLWQVMDALGFYNSDHEKYNLVLDIVDEDGNSIDEDKYEDLNKEKVVEN